jgi:acetyl-CoA carboxylase biotin carboxyl carrier protein
MSPESNQSTSASSTAESSADPRRAHEAIGRLAEDLVPALSAALAASGLAELELREAGWRVRVRRPADAGGGVGADGRPLRRRATDRGGRGHSAERLRAQEPHDGSANGAGPRARDESRPSRGDSTGTGDRFRAVATSPAVGRFRPARDVPAGTRVRAGDRLATVDVLGVPQDVAAPADGVVMATLVEPDDAVEYGQPLIEIERMSGSPSSAAAVGSVTVGAEA